MIFIYATEITRMASNVEKNGVWWGRFSEVEQSFSWLYDVEWIKRRQQINCYQTIALAECIGHWVL